MTGVPACSVSGRDSFPGLADLISPPAASSRDGERVPPPRRAGLAR